MKRKVFLLVFSLFPFILSAQWVKIDSPVLNDKESIAQLSSLGNFLFIRISSSPYRYFVTGNSGSTWKEISFNENEINQYVSKPSSFVQILGIPFISKNQGDTWIRTYGPNTGNPKYFITTYDMILVDTLLCAATDAGLMIAGWNNPQLPWYGNTGAWNSSLTDYDCFSFAQINDKIYLSTSNGILISTNKVLAWKFFALENKSVIKFFVVGNIMIAVTKSAIYFSADDGISWNEMGLNFKYLWNIELNNFTLYALTYDSDNAKSVIWSLNLKGVISGVDNSSFLPEKFSLSQNYPNPFNPSTTINYSVAFAGNVTLKIYDMLGREVATLVNEYKQPGDYSVIFSVEKLYATSLPSGVYFYQLQSGAFNQINKMILLK